MKQNMGLAAAVHAGSKTVKTNISGRIKDPRFSFGQHYGMVYHSAGGNVFDRGAAAFGIIKGEWLIEAVRRISRKSVWPKLYQGFRSLCQKSKALGLSGDEKRAFGVRNGMPQNDTKISTGQPRDSAPEPFVSQKGRILSGQVIGDTQNMPNQKTAARHKELTIDMKWNHAIMAYEFNQIADAPHRGEKHGTFSGHA